ncbi:hypothetical protein Poli38472_006096 [Pythium oligandrum]|uniref:RNA helicase n=1 Tax=Pythium oligandrum TaxID=41045 RepID=A0A8K1CTG5_PYTOL|nr:hypothetical protein Poli38472_006096 [Pythium oligandrum]|eukprot:TMW68628.1 hypothetical protein Poli38472_006096 [Pythium oligandrum]
MHGQPPMDVMDAPTAFTPLRKKLKSDAGSSSSTVNSAFNAPSTSVGDAQEARWHRLEHEVQVDGDEVPPMLDSFEAMYLPPHALEVLKTRGVMIPTPTQMQAIPSLLTGRDVIGLAATGSGKTLSYLLPWLVRIQYEKYAQGQRIHDPQRIVRPSAVVVVPTRELMDQVFHELCCFIGASPRVEENSDQVAIIRSGPFFTAAAVCGGVSLSSQIKELRGAHDQVDIIITTPGRILHLIEQRVVLFEHVTYLVLDEVDRMLDAEMESQLRQILHQTNETGRQTSIWSATMPPFLERLARSAVLNPITLRVGMGQAESGRTSLNVTQNVLFMRFAEKKTRLLQALRATPTPPVIVFCNSHESVDFVARVLRQEQFHVAGLHGDKSQAYRFRVLTAFREGYVDVLVATDLASRGLDFADVDHVILFDMPHTIEDYVHRCGRTGRRPGQSTGTVTAFLTTECDIAVELKKLLKETKQRIPLELEVPSRFRRSPNS